MKVSAIVLDLDGTLLDSNKHISERNMNAIDKMLHQNVRIIFATARPPRAVKSLLPENLLLAGSFVYYNGAQVSCRLSGLDTHEAVEAALSAEVIDFLLNMNPDIELGVEVRDEWFSLNEIDYTVRMNVKGNPIVKSVETLKTYDASKILVTGLHHHEQLKERFASRLHILLTDHGELVQISSLKASKERAVSELCQALRISLDEVIVFGDDYNDLGLFKICGWSVAMGNAIDELKWLASEVTDSNDEDGVAKVLERYR
ncbi:Cof-type HAD-IIB family hydrolase [Paenibacillus sp. SI8]|uniref:Cof-type HAD-IIB family hydrolase n=1 Tax=unclassified Paenibacillus TaxID=185978 RepID=UPI0034667B1C